MADIADIERAIVAVAAGGLFPAGGYLSGALTASAATAVPLPTPSVPSPTSGPVSVRLYRGWPEAAALTADLAASAAHVSVYSDPGMSRDVSRWPQIPVQITNNTPTVTAAVSGATVTLGGTVTAGNVVGVQFGAPAAAYAYVLQATDTLTTAAAALAGKIAGATSSGAVLTLPSGIDLAAATMVPQSTLTITRQQVQGVRVVTWAPTPQARDAIVAIVDGAFAGLKNSAGAFTRFMAVGANEAARIQYRGTYTNDVPARDRVWRRDLCYQIEYPTTLIEQVPAALFIGGPMQANGAFNQIGAMQPSDSALTTVDGNSVFIDTASNIVGAPQP